MARRLEEEIESDPFLMTQSDTISLWIGNQIYAWRIAPWGFFARKARWLGEVTVAPQNGTADCRSG
jgi:hypothetical protein